MISTRDLCNTGTTNIASSQLIYYVLFNYDLWSLLLTVILLQCSSTYGDYICLTLHLNIMQMPESRDLIAENVENIIN